MADVNENDTGSNAVSKQHYAFQDIYHFICSTRYPENMKDKGEKAIRNDLILITILFTDLMHHIQSQYLFK